MSIVPRIIEEDESGIRESDIFSRLLRERIVFIHEELTSECANVINSQLVYLESIDLDKDITLYIQSSSGSITAGLSVIDTMNYIKCDVATICLGMAADMNAVLLAAGCKGKRSALPNAEIRLSQPETKNAFSGQASDIEIFSHNINKQKRTVNQLLASFTGNTVEEIEADCERELYLSAEEAKAYGLLDRVII